MYSAIEMIRDENLHRNIDDIYCTGGGAYKYAKLIEEQLAVRFHKVGWCVESVCLCFVCFTSHVYTLPTPFSLMSWRRW